MAENLVRTPGGVTLSLSTGGKGPPLLLVHGTTTDASLWDNAAPLLAERLSVTALDRRGRGSAGDAETHSLAAEVEDIEAALTAIGARVHLLGHSYGALCALEAARRSSRVDKLVLYEPPLLPAAPQGLEAGVQAIEAEVAAGRPDGAVEAFFRRIEHLGDADLGKLRALPSWPRRVRAAHTIARELRAALGYRFDPERFAGFARPTLLLEGAESPLFLKQATRAVASAIAGSRVVSLPGQRHSAMTSAPERFAASVLGFLAPG
jgi:pimeloyl-ACP methyl ester carboxylesterase